MTLNLFHQPPIMPDGNFSMSMTFNNHNGFYDFGGDQFHEFQDDVNDLLPPDPFGMNVVDTTFTAFTAYLFGKSCDVRSKEESYYGDPHEALNYVLGYMGVKELLTVERVCKSLRLAVKDDPLLWREVCVESEKIDNDALLELTNRAQGKLRRLSLFKCLGVTSDGLERVLRKNRQIEKLSVPGCTSLDVNSIVKNIKDTQEPGVLKCIRMGERYDVTQEQFEKLMKLFHMKDSGQIKAHKPRIYHGRLSPVLQDNDNGDDDDNIIDIESCPRCENVRLIFDCPVDNCHMEGSTEECRGCITCITRCIQCGRCFNDGYIETFDLDGLCLYCFEQQPECVYAGSELIRGLG